MKNTEISNLWVIEIPRKVFDKMMIAAQKASPNEIQMIGEVERDGTTFRVEEIYILKQEVSGSSASFDMQALGDFLVRHQNPEKLKCWIHSHVNMETFWSGTDESTARSLVNSGWVISIVYNLREEIKARLDVKTLTLGVLNEEYVGFFPESLVFDNIRVKILPALSDEETARWEREVEENLVERFQSLGNYQFPLSQRDLPLFASKDKVWEPQDKLYSLSQDDQCSICVFDTSGQVCLRHKVRERFDPVSEQWETGSVNCKFFTPIE